MGRIVVTEFVSLDGVIEDPGGSESFKHGGWTFEIDRGEEGTFKLDETMATDALLLGRVTYEGFAEAWPSRDGEFADKFNACRSTSSPRRSRIPSGTTRLCSKATSPRRSPKLKASYDGDIVVHGSAQLVQALIEHDLVDELRLMVFPVVLGSRQAALRRDGDKKRLELVDTKAVGDGVVILTYAQPERAST